MKRAAVATLALMAAAARAQPYDPAFRWRTIDTPHFRVHHHQGEESLAQVVAREAERAHTLLAPRFAFEPHRTEIVLSDDTDDANGSATPLPYDTIRLFAVPPSSLSVLQDYRDWVRQVVQHEYVHILHLDHVGGLPAMVNSVFGKIWTPNAFAPAWTTEGLAVANEAEDRATGRNGSALFDMYARALATDGPFPRLDEASNPPLDWPLGNVPYLLGGRFMGYLESQYGQAAIARFVEEQAKVVWPYSPSYAARRWFGGKSFSILWSEYASAERAHAEGTRTWVRERPVTQSTRLTHSGGTLENPRFSPDGSFVAFFRRDLDRAPGIFKVAPDGRDLARVAVVDANGTLAIRSPSEALVAIGEVWHEFRQYDDLYVVDLRSGSRRRLTRGERATDPDVSRDGRTVVYARRTGAGTMALVRRSLDGGDAEVLYAHGGAQVFMPRIAPDGRVAFELHESGRRDIAVWQDGKVVRLTDDDALDTGPAWTPDGRYLLFASDRGGIFNLYACEPETGAIRQVTNVETGALQPEVSPDGKKIVFVSYSRAGYDLAAVAFDPATWLEPFPAPPPPPPAPAAPEEEPLPTRPYRALETARPTLWFPLLGASGGAAYLGALTAGTDVLFRHTWLAEGFVWTDGYPGYAFAYQGGWSWPSLDLYSATDVGGSPGPPDRLERQWTYADAGLTFTFTRLARRLALRLGWSGTAYSTVQPPAASEPPAPAEIRFDDGFLSRASLTAQYSDVRRFVRSISPEQGRTAALSLSLAVPELGSDFRLARAKASLAQYLRVPLTAHWVLALRLAGGAADGTIGGRAPFELGGYASPALASFLPGAMAAGVDQLRGYPSGALAGTGFALGNAELRFPIVRPGRGHGTWPLFLRRVHASLFVDAGETFDLPGELRFAGHAFDAAQIRLGAGAEVRLEVVLGYYLRTDVRIGVARALGTVRGGRAADRDAGIVLDEVVPYVVVGPSF